MIVEDEYLPVLDELGFERRIRMGDWRDASSARNFDAVPRTSDDVYVLYTGGTTGLPKGVMWRHEDIFFAAMGGGNFFGDPVASPDELGPAAAGRAPRAVWRLLAEERAATMTVIGDPMARPLVGTLA